MAAAGDPLGLIGTLLERKYRIDARVAEGGFGVVYVGQHLGLARRLAIKVLKRPAEVDADEWGDLVGQFLAEARMTAQLRHRAVVGVIDVGVAATERHPGGLPWIAMEWLDGETLAADLARRAASGEPARLRDEVFELMRPVVEAVAEAHDAGIVHRDLTPNNLMLVPGRLAASARILDFGIAKLMRPDAAPGASTVTAAGARAFSVAYAAPEQLAGAPTGPWTDVHALGLLLTELLCGRRAIAADDVDAYHRAALAATRPTPASRGIDAGSWEPILARALALDPRDRFASAGQLLAALDAAAPTRAVRDRGALDELTRTVSASLRGAVEPGDPGSPRLIVVCECSRPTTPALRVALGDVDEVTVDRAPRRSIERRARAATIHVPDREISRNHLAVRRRAGGWEVADQGSKNGILVNGEATRIAALTDGDIIEAGGTLLMFRDEGSGADCDRDLAAETDAPLGFRTVSVELEQRFAQLAREIRAGVAVVVRGELGTGKPVVARAIHESSGRSGAFVAIACGTAAAGGERDAVDRMRDACARAAGGTLFLDDVAELADPGQTTLVRALDGGGASAPAIVAATSEDLAARVADGTFRRDLHARLAGCELALSPLRDRREDLGTLIAALLQPLAPTAARITLHRSAARALLRYSWPRNIRELDEALHEAVALAGDCEIRLEHLPASIRSPAPASLAGLRLEDRVLRDRVIELLTEHGGDVVAVSAAIGMAPGQLRRWCRRLQIELGRLRG